MRVPIPKEFVKNRTEVTIGRASPKVLSRQKCGTHLTTR